MVKKITDVWGVGLQTAENLEKFGFKTIKDLAQATEVALAIVPGFGFARAKKVIAAAQQLQASEPKAKKPKKKKKPAVSSDKKTKKAKKAKKTPKAKKESAKKKTPKNKKKSKKKGKKK